MRRYIFESNAYYLTEDVDKRLADFAPGVPEPTADVISYIQQYGGRCRDCGDNYGICPNTNIPCADSDKTIKSVVTALRYGVKHGYITQPKEKPMISLKEKRTELMNLGLTIESIEDLDKLIEFYSIDKPGPAYLTIDQSSVTTKNVQIKRDIMVRALIEQRAILIDYLNDVGIAVDV